MSNITYINKPKPGSFGLAIISGKTGKLVQIGQDIVDGRRETYTHAFFVLDNDQVIEAEPGGAKIVPLTKYLNQPEGKVLFSDKPMQDYLAGVSGTIRDPLEDSKRDQLVEFARELKGVPYNYLDYLAIGLEHFNLDVKWVRDRVRRSDRMICSQLVDHVFAENNIHLFDDGRLPQDVTPGDLETYALA